MAQTIWIHKLGDAMEQSGKLNKATGSNPQTHAATKDGSTYRALFCDSCAKNYSAGHVRMAKEPVLV